MKYLTGATNDRDEPALVAAGVGLMVQPGNSYHLRIDRYPMWGADNGCFAGRWVEDEHFGWLEQLPRDRCLFAVSPDVYGDAEESLRRGLAYAPLVRELGFPVAVVAQDGAEQLAWPWDEMDCLFLGGLKQPNPRDEWKLGAAAAALAAEARKHGKWVHMGRVNSRWRLERARRMGCNSADGTQLKYRRYKHAPEGLGAGEVTAWVDWLDSNPPLLPYETPSLAFHRKALTL